MGHPPLRPFQVFRLFHMSNITTDFITATKKIHADVRSVLTSLHLIREDVRIIREETVESANKERNQQQKNDPNEKPSKRIVGGIDMADTNDPQKKKDESESKTRRFSCKFKKNLWKYVQKPQTYIEFLALLFLVLYTCETRRTN